MILENKGSFSPCTAVSLSNCQVEQAEQAGQLGSAPSAPTHPALNPGENPCHKFMAKGQSESQGSSPSTSTGSSCLLLWLLIPPCRREIGLSITHCGTGTGSSSRLMDWGGKADSPNSHITLEYKMQAFFPAFQKQSPGHSSPPPALEGEEGTRSCGLSVTGTELDWEIVSASLCPRAR